MLVLSSVLLKLISFFKNIWCSPLCTFQHHFHQILCQAAFFKKLIENNLFMAIVQFCKISRLTGKALIFFQMERSTRRESYSINSLVTIGFCIQPAGIDSKWTRIRIFFSFSKSQICCLASTKSKKKASFENRQNEDRLKQKVFDSKIASSLLINVRGEYDFLPRKGKTWFDNFKASTCSWVLIISTLCYPLRSWWKRKLLSCCTYWRPR